MNRRPSGRLIAIGSLLLIVIAALVIAELVIRPSPIAQLRMDQINAHAEAGGQVAMLWSIETYSDLLYTQGPRGNAAPTQIRIVSPAGVAGAPQPARTLDPAIHVGVCQTDRPSLGTAWWSGTIPHAMAEELRASSHTSWHLEAYLTTWVPVVLIDSGCRLTGRG